MKDKEQQAVGKPGRKPRTASEGAKSLGPVPNLEEHVHPEWWRQIFNATYLKTDGDVVDDPQLTGKEVDVFCGILNMSSSDRILDLCCGQGRVSLELARRGFSNVEGVDRSHYLIQRGKTQAKKEGLSLKLREGDARKLRYAPDTFDVVMILGNSFGYFETPEDDMRVIKEVSRVLKPWGRCLSTSPTGRTSGRSTSLAHGNGSTRNSSSAGRGLCPATSSA